MRAKIQSFEKVLRQESCKKVASLEFMNPIRKGDGTRKRASASPEETGEETEIRTRPAESHPAIASLSEQIQDLRDILAAMASRLAALEKMSAAALPRAADAPRGTDPLISRVVDCPHCRQAFLPSPRGKRRVVIQLPDDAA